MSYFREVSDILYQSQQTKITSSEDYVRTKNLFRRAKIRDDFVKSVNLFDTYKIVGEERPEQIAEKLYGSSEYDWVVLISNNIINIKNEWPLSSEEFNRYLNRKYSQEELESIHHYETTTYYSGDGKAISKKGKIVDSDYSITYFDETVNETLTVSPVVPITIRDYEIIKNERKRIIYTIKPKYLQSVIDDLRQIMSYGFSSQYVDDNTKKGDNSRIISP